MGKRLRYAKFPKKSFRKKSFMKLFRNDDIKSILPSTFPQMTYMTCVTDCLNDE